MKKQLCVIISSILAANAHAMTLEEASPKIRTKLMELAELAKDPANVVEENGERRLQYNGHKYNINFDGNIKFGLFGYDGNYGEFDAVFGFLPKEWVKYAYNGGFDLYPEGFDAENCTMGYYPAARGSNGPDGKPLWERETQILVETSGCTVTEKGPYILFNTNALPNVLEGALHGGVLFAQAHIIPAKDTSGEKRQHLVAQRKTMVMFKPEEVLKDQAVQMTARDAQGNVLGTLDMRHPDQLTRNVMHMDAVDDPNIDWSYEAGSVHEVRITNEQPEISSTNINNALAQYDVVKSISKNYGWVRDITLTDNDQTLNGKLFIFERTAGYGTNIHYSGRSISVNRGQIVVFKNINEVWVHQDDVLFNDIGYGDNFWSAIIPAEWVKPGFTLDFGHNKKSGTLTGIKVGAPAELLIHTIDVGMLVEPRDKFHFQSDKDAQREYFETIPVSRMVVTEYEPVHMTEVMLPDGTLLTDYDPSEGGWHGGTMRQHIGKELISLGINNANYGIHSTTGVGESQNIYMAAQLTAHNTRGIYSNGLQQHGGSGGGGMVTLDSTIGNEWSHEIGHNYGLGHYPGGFEGSVHTPAHMSNSTWGWDSGSDHFIPNFSPEKSGEDACLEGQCVPPFHGMFRMGNDAMASGWAMYNDQRYTLHTPYSMYYIQKNLESKAVFDESSATGFRKWNDQTESMEEYPHRIDTLEVTTVAPLDGNAEKIAMLFGHYDKVQLNTRNGYWAKDISLPAASSANKGKVFVFESEASYTSNLSVNGESVKIVRGSKHTYVSNGQIWVKDGTYTANKAIKPKDFGVPVTTLVGYYDPQKALPTYIYQPLHGAFGYTYADDADTLNASDCALEVVKSNGDVLKFRLKNNRQNASAMNKFHVNIARADQPNSASVVCSGTVLDTMAITDPKKDPIFTVQGLPLGGVAPAQRIAASKVPRVAATRYEPEQCAKDHDHSVH